MNWQLFGLTFITVFLAEIGDKSQLVAIALGGSSAGGSMAQLFPAKILKAIAAIGFALLAVRLLWPDSD